MIIQTEKLKPKCNEQALHDSSNGKINLEVK
jgi:hypothetical protein